MPQAFNDWRERLLADDVGANARAEIAGRKSISIESREESVNDFSTISG